MLDEGNFVPVTTETAADAQPIAFYDLFRVKNIKVDDQCNTAESIPLRADWKKYNGKY